MTVMSLPENLIEFQFSSLYPEEGFIYFLLDDKDKLLYIGQTIYLEQRISTHLRNDKIPFIKCKYIICKRCEMTEMEFENIVRYSPPYNGPPPPSKNWISIDQAKKKFPNFKGKAVLLRKSLSKGGFLSFNGYFRVEDIAKLNEEIFGGSKCL